MLGFSWTGYDRLEGGRFSCRVDLESGSYGMEATRRDAASGAETPLFGESGQSPPAVVALETWNAFSRLPSPCDAGHARYLAGTE